MFPPGRHFLVTCATIYRTLSIYYIGVTQFNVSHVRRYRRSYLFNLATQGDVSFMQISRRTLKPPRKLRSRRMIYIENNSNEITSTNSIKGKARLQIVSLSRYRWARFRALRDLPRLHRSRTENGTKFVTKKRKKRKPPARYEFNVTRIRRGTTKRGCARWRVVQLARSVAREFISLYAKYTKLYASRGDLCSVSCYVSVNICEVRLVASNARFVCSRNFCPKDSLHSTRWMRGKLHGMQHVR